MPVRPLLNRERYTLENGFVFILWCGFAVAVLHAFYVLMAGLFQPLLDIHAFRQTMTAVTSYWLVQGGPWIAYQTPVLGAPWSIPLEFPIYQWIVALLFRTGIPLDAAGRLVSFTFYVATLWPLSMAFRAYGLGRIAFLSSAILFLTAPLYVFWSRTVLIESCALFLSALALGLLATYLRTRSAFLAVAATLAGTAAALQKVTTFPAFAVVGACLIGCDLVCRIGDKRSLRQLAYALVPAMVLTLPFVFCLGWVGFADNLKLANEFGAFLTSKSLMGWNLGTFDQRVSAGLWRETVRNRVLPDLFGASTFVAFVAAGATLARPRFVVGAVLAAIGFFTPFLLFTNLHIVHNYYQYSNGIFAVAAVGMGIASISEVRRPLHYVVAGGLLASVVAGQIIYYRHVFAPWVTRDYQQDSRLQAALFVKDHTPAGASILVLGDDWASTVPYYAERVALALPAWAPPALIDKVLADPQAYLGDRSLGAIVFCSDRLGPYQFGGRIAAMQRFVAERTVLGRFGGCDVVTAN